MPHISHGATRLVQHLRWRSAPPCPCNKLLHAKIMALRKGLSPQPTEVGSSGKIRRRLRLRSPPYLGNPFNSRMSPYLSLETRKTPSDTSFQEAPPPFTECRPAPTPPPPSTTMRCHLTASDWLRRDRLIPTKTAGGSPPTAIATTERTSRASSLVIGSSFSNIAEARSATCDAQKTKKKDQEYLRGTSKWSGRGTGHEHGQCLRFHWNT